MNRYVIRCNETGMPITSFVAQVFTCTGGEYQFYRAHSRQRQRDVIAGTAEELRLVGVFPKSNKHYLDIQAVS